MLKHCHNSSIRLQRRCHGGLIINPDTVSLNSTVTVHSSCGSSESNTSDSLNSSFQIISDDQCYNVANNNLYQRNSYEDSPDQPVSLSSRASSYVSLADPGPKTTIKVFASCLRPDIEYKTLSIGNVTTSKSVIWQLLSKYKMKHRDPKLFFLTLEVVIQKPGRDGLTKKTLVLDDDSKPAELKNCTPWGECRFVLQMKKGGVVKIHDSVLMEESQYKCLFISEETTVEEVIMILLHCYGLEKLERAERYSMYEQCNNQRYHRRLHSEERPLAVQSLWAGPSQFCFVLKRSPTPVTMNRPLVSGESSGVWTGHSRGVQASAETVHCGDASGRNSVSSHSAARPVVAGWPGHKSGRAASVESQESSAGSSDQESWGETDKDTEEHLASLASNSDMDMSVSSNDSPTPPGLVTSTPLAAANERPSFRQLSQSESREIPVNNNMPRPPPMSFLFPSPDYASFPASLVPSRPYSSMSASSQLSISSKVSVRSSLPPPSLPPKPSTLGLGTLVGGSDTRGLCSQSKPPGSFHDYENYFFI